MNKYREGAYHVHKLCLTCLVYVFRCRLHRADSIPMHLRNGSIPSVSVSSSTIDRGTPSVKNLRRTPSDQSSTYKKYSPATTASSSPSTSMFKQKHKWETSLETVESNLALRVSSQSSINRDHPNLGDNDARPQMPNNMISSSDTTLHHHRHHHRYPIISPSDSPAPGEVGKTVEPSTGNSLTYIVV